MKKFSLLTLALTCCLASAGTSDDEYKGLTKALDELQRTSYDDKTADFAKAEARVDNCLVILNTLITARASVVDEPLPGFSSTGKVSGLLNDCQKNKTYYHDLNTPQVKAITPKLLELLEHPNYVPPNECVDRLSAVLKQYPTLKNFDFGGETKGVGEVYESCKASITAKANDQKAVTANVTQGAASLKSDFDKLNKKFQAAKAMPEKNDNTVLLKYREMQEISKQFNPVQTKADNLLDDSSKNIKVNGLTVGALVAQINAAAQQSAAAYAAVQLKADKAFDRQDAQVQATVPKITSGDRRDVFKRFGIPGSWSGGPVLSKDGIFSGDGISVAKDIASSTQWFYNENSQGCSYRFYFNKNTVTKVDKPLGC